MATMNVIVYMYVTKVADAKSQGKAGQMEFVSSKHARDRNEISSLNIMA